MQEHESQRFSRYDDLRDDPREAAPAPLRGRVALVTGGGRGLGRAIATALARAGAHVALTWRERRTPAVDLAARLRAGGARALALPLALEDPASIAKAMAEIRSELGPITILVNNAAMAQEKPFESLDERDWERMLAADLRGPALCAREVIGDMRAAGWGRIVNLTSIGGQWGGVNQVHYACAKAGLIGLTRSLARLYSREGITTNAIAPGLVRTEMSGPELDSPAGRAKLAAIPAGRTGRAEEVAEAVVYLCSDAAAYVTGQTLNLNGGMYFG